MSLAGRIDYVIEQGSRWYPDVLLWADSDGNPKSLASYAVKLHIRANKDSSSALEVMSSAFGDITLGGVNGTIQINMSGERTLDMTSFTRAVYDLLLFPYVGSAIVATADYTSADVDVDDGSDGATITAIDGTPFANISVDDYVAITLSENGHEGIYKVTARTDTKLTFGENLPGTDNTTDTTISIQELSNENAERFIDGYVTMSKGVTS